MPGNATLTRPTLCRPGQPIPPGNTVQQDSLQWHTPLFTDEKRSAAGTYVFGQPVNVARYDQQKYDIFEKLIEKQLSFFWRPEEVDVSRSHRLPGATGTRKTYFHQQPEVPDAARLHRGRSPNVALLPLISIPELETRVETRAFSRPFTRVRTLTSSATSSTTRRPCSTTSSPTSRSETCGRHLSLLRFADRDDQLLASAGRRHPPSTAKP